MADKLPEPKARKAAKPAEQPKITPVAKPEPVSTRRQGVAGKIALVVVSVLVVIVVVFAVLIYGTGSTSPITAVAARAIPYPAERVNGQFVSYNDYLFEVKANQTGYQSNAKLNNEPAVDWKSTAGKKLLVQIKQHALTKLEDDVITAQLARKYNVSVSDKDVTTLLNTLYQKSGGKETTLKTVSGLYGWNLNDLRSVIRKKLLDQKVQAAVSKDPAVDAQAKAKATAILGKLKGGADFTTTAKAESQASDAANGGDMGSFTKSQVDDATYTAAAALQPGSLSDVIKTQYGYQIVKVIDKTGDTIHAQEILIKKIDYTTYLAQQEKAAKVKTFVKTA